MRIHDSATVNLGRLAANFPAHVLVAESVETGVIANWLSSILELLQDAREIRTGGGYR